MHFVKSFNKSTKIYKDLYYINKKMIEIMFDKNAMPSIDLLELLEIIGMPELNSKNITIDKINEWAQENILRQGERWDEQTTKFEMFREKIINPLTNLGFINEINPSSQMYEGAILLGATTCKMKVRLQYLINQYNNGIRFNSIHFLVSERLLENQEVEEYKNEIKKPKTEYEAMSKIWENIDAPESMRKNVKIYFVNTPMQGLKRPTTDDTVVEWLKLKPNDGKYLVISNAPYIQRQNLVMKTNVRQDDKYEFETVGSKINNQETIAIILDEVARTIFQTKRLLEPLNGDFD